MFQLYESSMEFRDLCEMHADISLDQHTHDYEEYLDVIADTTFTLCPAGNNPETFRLYETIELGSIPVFIRPPHGDKNYLQYSPWSSYPGAILDSISDIVPYLSIMEKNPAKVNRLQSDLRKWYQLFKEFIQDDIGAKINNVLNRSGDVAKGNPMRTEEFSRRILKLESEVAEYKLLTKHLLEKTNNLEIFISNFMTSNHVYIQNEQV